MRLKGKTWSFFAGYDQENDEWAISYRRGRSEVRMINGLYPYASFWRASVYYPLRYLKMRYFIKPRFRFERQTPKKFMSFNFPRIKTRMQ
jgi:hypothetical protein